MLPTLYAVVVVAALAAVGGHRCVHDEVADTVAESAWSQAYGSHSVDLDASASVISNHNTRHLETASSGSPLRVVPYFDNVTLGALPADKRSLVQDYLVPAAASFWSQALRVIPIQGNLYAAPPCTSAWNTVPSVCASLAPTSYCFEMPYPPEHYSPIRVCSTCLSTGCATGNCTVVRPNNTGVPNADMVMYIRAATTTRCTPNTLAYAITCQRDQFDRPTFGMINFCPQYLDASQLSGPSYDVQVTTALHEFAHALGFSSASFPLMRNRDGTPRTDRQGGGRTGRPVASTGTCANGTAISSTGLPSNSTVKYRNIRGHAVTYMATPTVTAFTTAHFNCPSAIGAEIENNDGSCMGSHWEERLFGPELMTPVVNYRNPTSALTLAFFEDTGWYQANFSMAEPLMWGNSRGCPFTADNCVSPNGSTGNAQPVDADTYCSEDGEACAPDGLSRSWCSLKTDYATDVIPPWFQYFSTPTTGGYSEFGDYCPMQQAYSNGDCMDTANLALIPNTQTTPLGEIYGQANSRCALSTLRLNDMMGYQYRTRRAGCYPMVCTGQIIQVSVQTVDGGAQTVQCNYKGEDVTVPGFTGTLTCPDPFVVCQLARCSTPCGARAMCINGQCTPLMAPATAPSPSVANTTVATSPAPVITTASPTTTAIATAPTTAAATPVNTSSTPGNTTISTTASPTTTPKKSHAAVRSAVPALWWIAALWLSSG